MAGGLRRTTLASYRLENWCPFGLPNRTNHSCTSKWKWWLGAELNRRHKDFQSSALPTELPSQTIAATIDGVYYAQVRVGGHIARVRLEHTETVPQAVTELQALKKRRPAGKLTLPRRLAAQMEHKKGMCSRPNSC